MKDIYYKHSRIFLWEAPGPGIYGMFFYLQNPPKHRLTQSLVKPLQPTVLHGS